MKYTLIRVLTNTFDAANHLIETTRAGTTLQPFYDGLGNRVGQTVGLSTTTFALDVQGLPEVISTGAGNAYLYLPGVIVAENAAGERRFLLPDGLGSVRQATDETGVIVAYHAFDPYGNPVADGGDPYGYTGEWWEAEVGLLYLRARWYRPETGSFVSRDPVAGESAYLYVQGNPINLADPSGMIPHFPLDPFNSCGKDNICIRLFGRKPVVYRKAKYDLIIFPEGYHSEDIVKLFELENEDMAFWSGASGVALDIGELAGILSPGDMGISDVVAVADLLAATLASASVGETYVSSPHPDFPEMAVVGQDILVAAFDTGVGSGGKWAFRGAAIVATVFGQPEVGATLYVIGQGLDLTTTIIQGTYDTGRLFFDFPTLTALGFYATEGQGARPVILLYCSF